MRKERFVILDLSILFKFFITFADGAYTITQYTDGGMMLIKRDDYYAKDAVLQENIQFLFMEPDVQYENFIQKKLYYATDITDDLRLATFGIDQSPIVTSPAYGVTCITLP